MFVESVLNNIIYYPIPCKICQGYHHKNAKLCYNSCMKTKKLLTLVMVTLCVLNLNFTADGLSTKLRGKLVLAGILSGTAILTISLVKHDRVVSENLLSDLGRAEAIWKIDRGFDAWYVHQYKAQSYYFLNNRLMQDIPPYVLLGVYRKSAQISSRGYFPLSFIGTTALASPKWLSFSLWRQQRAPLSACFYLRQSVDGRLLNLDQWHHYLK